MRRWLPLAAATAAVGMVVVLGRPMGSPGSASQCTRAVMVDGRLRCDAQAPRDTGTVCVTRAHTVPMRVRSGDALDLSTLCRQRVLRRGGPGWGRMATSDLRALGQPVDINSADVDELRSLRGVGPTIANRIVEGRPYAAVRDLERVKGIGPKTLEANRKRIIVFDSP